MNSQQDLHDYYLIDQQVRGLERRSNAARKRVAAQTKKLDKLQEQKNLTHDKLMHEKATAAELENEANALEAKIEKIREQMANSRNNKEYSALLKEAGIFKADKGNLEDQSLGHLTKVDELQAKIDEIDAQISEIETIKAVADKELSEREAEIGEDLDKLKVQRESSAKNLDADTLNAFQRLVDGTDDGEPLAEVEETDRRRMEYTCGGCYMQLPVEVLNKILHGQELVRCPSCFRYLHIDGELRSTFSG